MPVRLAEFILIAGAVEFFYCAKKIPDMKVKGPDPEIFQSLKLQKLRETNNFGDCGSLHFCD